MGTDVAIRDTNQPATVRLTNEQLRYIAQTEFVPRTMRGKLPQILACIAMGRELGLGDMVALNTIHVIDGRASLSAEAMVSLVRRRGHSIQGNFSGDSCTVVGRRADNQDEMTVTWTKEMAQDAGLLGKDNYKKYRPAMLWARAVSQLCRMLFADCFAGGTYTPDELSAGADEAEWDASSAGDVASPSDAIEAGEASHVEAASPAGADSGLEPSEDQMGAPLDAAASAAETSSSPDVRPPSAAMLKKLNVLVGTLRDRDKLITTEQLWTACGHVPELSGDENGELHWSPLRDSLSWDEAHDLIDRLERFAESKAAA